MNIFFQSEATLEVIMQIYDHVECLKRIIEYFLNQTKNGKLVESSTAMKLEFDGGL